MNNEELMRKFCSKICGGYQRCSLKPELIDTCDILAYLQEIYKAGMREMEWIEEELFFLEMDLVTGKYRLCFRNNAENLAERWQAFKQKLGLEEVK